METRAPSRGRILTMVIFALSCFGLLLYVWTAFGGSIPLKPRGYHLLFEQLARPLGQGERVPVTLTFEKAGTRQIELLVEAPGPIGNDALVEGQPG